MKIAVVLNLNAGTLMGMPGDEAASSVAGTFRRHGAEIEVAAIEAAHCVAEIKKAVASDADVVLVGGGDGTIATAANLVMPTGKAMGILPLGTMNLLARDLGLSLDLQEAVESLATGTIRGIDVGSVNGEYFLNNSVLGIYPTMVQERERQRGAHNLKKWPAMAVAAVKALHRYPMLDVTIDLGAGPKRVRTPILAVASAPYEKGYGPVLRRPSLEGGKLGVYLAHHRSPWAMMRLIARMGFGTWAEDEELDSMTTDMITVHSRRRRLRVANDGEVRIMTPPLTYRIHPKGLRMLVPGPELQRVAS